MNDPRSSFPAAPMVKFMLEHMAKCGCPVGDNYFTVRNCDEKVGGGFDAHEEPHGGIVLCENHIKNYKHAGVLPPPRTLGWASH